MFKYASLLSKEFNVPWIADYRDDWVYDHSLVNKPFLYRFIIDSKNKYFEKVYLANSSCILTGACFGSDGVFIYRILKRGFLVGS